MREGGQGEALPAALHPYMPGAPLNELARLESAAAWRQLRDEADRALDIPGLPAWDRGWIYVYRAWGALGENDLTAAGNDAAAARPLMPHALQPVLLQCIVQARQGGALEAESRLKERTQRGEPHSEEHAAMAAFYQANGDWMSAGHWYGEALNLAPNSARLNASICSHLPAACKIPNKASQNHGSARARMRDKAMAREKTPKKTKNKS